jgi:hypothetical protein
MARARAARGFVRGLPALVAALALACTSPTLPLPPPAAPLISVGTEPGTFHLASIAGSEPNALIVIVNRDEALPRNKRVTGTIADEHGTWDANVIANVGDVLDISQESGTTRSPGTTVTVR